jgi:DNA-directed RNA polymerase subunit RPC12/RpoP
MDEDASYICDSCGEQIVIPIDLTAGDQQDYVEDCPVCCNPNLIHVRIDEDGQADVWSEAEQDH